jgi:antitoxin component YwqK of YwqJK toxin-antitoxin module
MSIAVICAEPLSKELVDKAIEKADKITDPIIKLQSYEKIFEIMKMKDISGDELKDREKTREQVMCVIYDCAAIVKRLVLSNLTVNQGISLDSLLKKINYMCVLKKNSLDAGEHDIVLIQRYDYGLQMLLYKYDGKVRSYVFDIDADGDVGLIDGYKMINSSNNKNYILISSRGWNGCNGAAIHFKLYQINNGILESAGQTFRCYAAGTEFRDMDGDGEKELFCNEARDCLYDSSIPLILKWDKNKYSDVSKAYLDYILDGYQESIMSNIDRMEFMKSEKWLIDRGDGYEKIVKERLIPIKETILKARKEGKSFVAYYTNGTKMVEGRFKNGKLSGRYIKHYPNGKLKEMLIFNFFTDKLEKTFKFYENGNNEFQQINKTDKFYLRKWFNINGKLIDSKEYSDKFGVHNVYGASYRKNGTLEKEWFYENGEFIRTKEYDENERLIDKK